MSDRTFTIAGFSTLSGQRKVRFANNSVADRTKILERSGHVEIELHELPKAMTKAEAMEFLGVAEDDMRAPKGVQAAAAKAKKTVTKVIELKTELKAAAEVDSSEVATV